MNSISLVDIGIFKFFSFCVSFSWFCFLVICPFNQRCCKIVLIISVYLFSEPLILFALVSNLLSLLSDRSFNLDILFSKSEISPFPF